MKATLDFDLTEPGERYLLDCVLRAPEFQCEMREFDEWMRTTVKHGGALPAGVPPGLTAVLWQEAVAAVRDVFLSHVAEAGGFVDGC